MAVRGALGDVKGAKMAWGDVSALDSVSTERGAAASGCMEREAECAVELGREGVSRWRLGKGIPLIGFFEFPDCTSLLDEERAGPSLFGVTPRPPVLPP